MPKPFTRFLWTLAQCALYAWVLGIAATQAQLPIEWDKTLGGTRYEELNAIQIKADGIVLGGSSNSSFPFGWPNDQSWNVWVGKVDFSGNLLWQEVYGGNQDERLWALIPTADGGFLAGGYSYSGISGDKTEANRGDMDVWIVKLSQSGSLEWEKTLGGAGRDELFAALEMPGGGFLLGCHSTSDAGGDKSENSRGGQDFWIVRVDAQGKKIWDKTIGGDNYDQIHDLELAEDGTVYLSGGTLSTPGTGEMSPMAARGGMDFWLLRFNPSTQQVLWNRRYGGSGEDFAYALCVSNSGKLYFGGRSGSLPAPSGDANGRDLPFFGGDSDYWMLELDSKGNKLREWAFGGDQLDDLYFIQEHPHGQLVLGGVTNSDISGNKSVPLRGGYDYWLVGLDRSGNLAWQQTIAGSGNDAMTKIARMNNGALVLGGHSDSGSSFDKTESSKGVNDFWVVKTRCDLQITIEPQEVNPCNQDSLYFTAQLANCQGCYWIWNTGDTAIRTIALPAGTNKNLIVEAWDEYGCYDADTLAVNTPENPSVELGPPDTLLQSGSSIVLGSVYPYALQYLWNTGETTPIIVISAPGVYTVTVTFEGGCTASDAIRVLQFFRGSIYVPNIITPNLDGLHDHLNVYHGELVRNIVTFQVADRWGGIVFRRDHYRTEQEWDGWDGEWRGKPVEMGVYSWFTVVEFIDGTQELYKGDVTVIR